MSDLIIDQMTEQYVRCGRVLIRTTELEERLSAFASPLLFMDGAVQKDLGDFALSSQGSCANLMYEGVPFLAATSHQIIRKPASGVCIYDERSQSVVTCSSHNSYRFDTNKIEWVRKDVELFGFSGASASVMLKRHQFFPIAKHYGQFSIDQICFVIVVGYPYQVQSWNIDQSNLVFRPFSVLAEFKGKGHADYLVAEAYEELEINPDGLSGGPVFFVLFSGSEYYVELGGIVATANKKLLHFIPLTFALPLLSLSGQKNPVA